MKKTCVSLIGAPTDVGAGLAGTRMGPEALRVAGIAEAIARFGLEVRDGGNVAGPANPGLPAIGGFRHLAEVTAWNRAVHDAVYAELGADRLPILLGGDHSLSIGSISAVARHCRERGRIASAVHIGVPPGEPVSGGAHARCSLRNAAVRASASCAPASSRRSPISAAKP